jgi:hypothetical protein
MNSTICARLVRFMDDGEYLAAPLTLEGGLVQDEDYGWVLEFVMPTSGEQPGETAMLITLQDLRKIAGCAGPVVDCTGLIQAASPK